MLRRSLRTRVRVGAAARRRIQDGGPRATGRPAASLEEWAVIRRVVFRRARWRCQACGRGGALEVPHVVKRARGLGLRPRPGGGALSGPPCHAQTDAPYVRGRLVITPFGGGRFTVEVIRGADKWGDGLFAYRAVEEAAAALETIVADYARHARAARDVAVACFSPEAVLLPLIEKVTNGRE